MKKHLERKVKAGKYKPKLKDIDPNILPAAWSILRWLVSDLLLPFRNLTLVLGVWHPVPRTLKPSNLETSSLAVSVSPFLSLIRLILTDTRIQIRSGLSSG